MIFLFFLIILLLIILIIIYKKKSKPYNFSKIINSKWLYNSQYSKTHTEHVSSEETIINIIKNSKDIIWIRNTSKDYHEITDLDIFANNIDKLINPIILVTSDGDRDVPSSYSNKTVTAILNSDKVISWYTQNYDRSIINQKLRYFPIGLDLHSSKFHIKKFTKIPRIEKINYILKNRFNYKIKNKIFCDSHNSITHPDRKLMYSILKDNKSIYFLKKKVSFDNIVKHYSSYQFVLSPRGNGIDCHRTWELFLLGAIVITKTSPLDQMYLKNKLPVVIIKDWNELNDNIETKLNFWFEKYIELTSIENIYPKYDFFYWINNNPYFIN